MQTRYVSSCLEDAVMNNKRKSISELPKGPFTATKLWNEAVTQMKASLTVKRRRWRMKLYDDAFVASEAVDWMHEYLKRNPNFDHDITRQQAVQLCQKFLTNGIIEDVRGKGYNTVFEDNSHLYSFVSHNFSPYKRLRSSDKKLSKEISSQADLRRSSSSSFPGIQGSPRRKRRRSSFSLRPTLLSAAPSRTPLVNKMNILGSMQSDSKVESKAAGKRRRLIRRDSSSSIIMNPVALGFQQNRRSLSEKEMSDVWWNITITRLSTLLDMKCSSDSFKGDDYDISCARENAEEQQRICKASEVVPPWLLSAMKCLVQWPLDNRDPSSTFPKYPGFECDVFQAVVEHFEGFDGPLIEENILPLFIKTAGTIVKCKVTALKSLQYCCLLLQPSRRRTLQVLIKFMVKLAQNHNLSLSKELPTRELVIKTFSKCTFGRTGDIDVIRLLFFMMENFPEFFKRPEGLRFQAEQRILFLQNCRGNTHSLPQQKGVTYCERVTKKEFEEHSMLNSQKALRDLLNQVIDDESMSEKQRKKQLKQFEKSYPRIYYARLPGDNTSSSSLLRPERKKSLMKPLAALKTFR